MPIFFLIDTSGSMEGKKIGAVNSAIEELIPDLRHLSESQADSENQTERVEIFHRL